MTYRINIGDHEALLRAGSDALFALKPTNGELTKTLWCGYCL